MITGQKQDQALFHDIGPRKDSSMEKLAKLKPYFDRKTGSVTVGNSCPITDGGAIWLLANEEALKEHNLTPVARIVDYHFHGLEPERMGLGPVLSSYGLMKKTKMKLSDMDRVELNEAFAAQVLACLKVSKDKELSARWDMDSPLGEFDMSTLNVRGGAIALGHPVGATGARLVVTLAHELEHSKKRYGLATLCIGGGQGGAMMIENLKR